MRINKTSKNKRRILSNIVINVDEKVLAHEIIKANEEYERYKITEKETKEKKEQEDWLKNTLKQKEYSSNEKLYLKIIHNFRNDFFCFKELLFIKEEKVRDVRATFALMRLAVIGILNFCKWTLYFCAVSIIYGAYKNNIEIVLGCVFASVLWLFARIFRLASFEVGKIEDGNLIISIFSGVLSFVAVIIAILTIVVDKI